MKDSDVAIAVFVKTPGLSPIKTRLSEGLGREKADEFYRLSVSATEAAVAAAAESFRLTPYWAVAESAGLADARWRRFPCIDQGTGSLGERLARVFDELGTRHSAVIAIGGDAPQITRDIIGRAYDFLSHDCNSIAHVLGRCRDGGFYLIGSKRRLPPAVWRNVRYSTQDTANQLAANLTEHGLIAELVQLSDVDQFGDLAVLKDELIAVPNPSRQQRAVLNWIDGAVEDWG